MNFKAQKLYSHGISLLELMLTLTVVAIILVTAARFYKSTSSAQKVNTAADMLQAVINASEDWKTTTNSYIGIINIKFLTDQGTLPKEFLSDNANPWHGKIDVTAISETQISITLSGIPIEACNSLSDIMVKKGMDVAICSNSNFQANYPGTSATP